MLPHVEQQLWGESDMSEAGFHTYRGDISKHLSCKSLLDVSTVSLLLLHDVFPVRVGHNEASLLHRELGWRGLNREGDTGGHVSDG